MRKFVCALIIAGSIGIPSAASAIGSAPSPDCVLVKLRGRNAWMCPTPFTPAVHRSIR